jgi:hypothetical protein
MLILWYCEIQVGRLKVMCESFFKLKNASQHLFYSDPVTLPILGFSQITLMLFFQS